MSLRYHFTYWFRRNSKDDVLFVTRSCVIGLASTRSAFAVREPRFEAAVTFDSKDFEGGEIERQLKVVLSGRRASSVDLQLLGSGCEQNELHSNRILTNIP